MKITDILPEALVVPALQGQTKEAVLRELAEQLAALHPEVSAERLVDVLWERERLGSTAIGDGIAIPHGKLPGLKGVLAAFGRHPQGVDFESLDGKPTKLFFLLVAPEDSVGLHLKALARVSRLLKEQAFRNQLMAASDRHVLYEIIRQEDEKY
ncbi:MAG: putative IIA-like nitrogen-regulatory protein PtsN [Deltaproteobacteria bacterium]|jgi:PTS system nitrogen regulatory IIA component|nr:putative IIA-like nitrogen-regulatory protein PtsN [Deltaproteobacteria bacterium]